MKYLSIIYVLLICLLILSANNNALPGWFGIYKIIPFGDQVGHFILIGILSLSFNVLSNLKQISILNLNIFLGSLLVVSLITIEEFSQIFINSRTFSFADLFANYLGILFFGHFISSHIVKRRLAIVSSSN